MVEWWTGECADRGLIPASAKFFFNLFKWGIGPKGEQEEEEEEEEQQQQQLK